MGFWATFYSLATLAMFSVCAVARLVSSDADRLARAASWVVLFTGVSRFVSLFVEAPWSIVHYPAIDLFLMWLAFGWWQVRGETWAWLLGACLLTQLGLHCWFWGAGDAGNLYAYILANNIGFFCTLLTLTIAGSGHVVGWLRDRLRLTRRGYRGVLALGVAP